MSSERSEGLSGPGGGTSSGDGLSRADTASVLSRQPSRRLDFRLLPAAAAAWVCAWAGVHSSWRTASAVVGVMVLGICVCLVCLMFRWVASRLMARTRGPRHSRTHAVQWLAHLVLVLTVSAAVLATCAMTQRHHDASGWTAAVSGETPFEVTLRVTGDAQVLDRPGFAGEDRVLAQTRVMTAELPRHEATIDPQADAALIASVPEDTDAGTFLTAGHTYRVTVKAQASDPGQRSTALLFPFGDHAVEPLGPDGEASITDVFNALRAATARAAAHAVGDAPGLLPGLILGDRSHQDAELDEAMRDAGLSHLTAVSGANCALILGSLWAVGRVLGLPRWTMLPIGLAGLALFILLVHPEPSVIRAGVMGGIGALSLFAGRGRTALSLLCVCVLVLLVYDPWFSTAPAFQLSAAATLGIILAGTPAKEWMEQWLPGIVAGPLALAFSAQLFVTPILLPLSSSINTYAVPANLLAAPLVPFITVPGTVAALISTTLPWLSSIILWCSGIAAAGIGAVGRFTAALPQATAPWPEGPWGAVLVVTYSAAAVVLVHMLVTRRSDAHNGQGPEVGQDHPSAQAGSGTPPGRTLRWRRVRVLFWTRVVVLGSAGGTLCALVVPAGTLLLGSGLPEHWRIALCDVGQGDMLVVRTGAEAGIIVDTGEEPGPAAECLTSLKISEVPLLMVTHDHSDHYGGNEGVFNTARVQRVLFSGSASWDLEAEMDFLERIEDPPPVERAEPGQLLAYDEDRYPVSIHVVAAAAHHSNPNDNSLAALFNVAPANGGPSADGSATPGPDLAGSAGEGGLTLLTTGDLEETVTDSLVRRQVMPADVDVLKVAHHGAKNGGTALLRHARPAVALIGVGADNSYGHPAPVIAETLEEVGAVTYRTDIHGTVVLTQENARLEVAKVP